MSSDDKGSAAAPKRVESDVYDRQIRLWGADAQVGVVLWLVFLSVPLPFVPFAMSLIFFVASTTGGE